MNATITYTGTIVVGECCSCGIRFGVPSDFRRNRREDRLSFYCPNGHPQQYVQTEEQRLRNQLAAAKSREDQLYASLQSSRDETKHERSRAAALKGVVTKTRRRVGNGVCPCCNRTFQQLARHMAHKHPDYATPESDPAHV